MKMKRLACAAVVLMSVCSSLCPLNAQEGHVDDLEDRSLTLTVDFSKEKDNGEKYGIEGGSFKVYKAADLKVVNGCSSYEVVAPYTSLNIEDYGRSAVFSGQETEDARELAKAFSEVKNDDIKASGTTDENGQLTVSLTEPGMYLVVESAADGTASGYAQVEPIFVSVPLVDAVKGSWNYDVTVLPKTREEKPTPGTTENTPDEEIEPSPSPSQSPEEPESNKGQPGTQTADGRNRKNTNTGVASHTEKYRIIMLCASAACLLIGLILIQTRDRKGGKDSC